MTTTDAAQEVVSALMKGQRRELVKTEEWDRVFFHLGIWGPGKVGKTHLTLSAESTEIRKPDTVNDKFEVTARGETLIPPRRLSVAYANFDREASTVISNLEDGFSIVTEDFYLDENGALLVALAMLPSDFIKLFARLKAFIADALEDEVDLLVVDGATVIWENVREWKLPKGEIEAGEVKGVAPKQYATSNTAMRNEIMSHIRSAPIHTILTRESAQVWDSASAPRTDATGEIVLRPDGWNKTSHYVDMDVQMVLRSDAMGRKRIGIPNIALKPAVIGAEIEDPTFEELFRRNFGHPLVLRQDIDAYRSAQEEYGSVSTGSAT